MAEKETFAAVEPTPAGRGCDMPVYVDGSVHPFGRMVMCHMMADSTEELMVMATKIGVAHRWIQKAGTRHEHFDICKSKRERAVENGAVEVTSRELVCRMKEKSV
jgi:hypothetical protein